MNNKPIVLQSILWAAAMIVVAISESKEITILLLVILGTCSTIFFRKKLDEAETVYKTVESFEKNRRR